MPPERPNRGAAAFDAFRRELIRKCLPVQKEARSEWEKLFKEFVEQSLPEPQKIFSKPGLAARMFFAEIELPRSHPRDLEVYAQQLELVWEAKVPESVTEWRTLVTPDRHDVIWECAVDLGCKYVTCSVKLRNYTFEKPAKRDDGERRPYRRREEGEDRPRRPYQKRDDGDRPRRPYQKREDGDRPSRPYQRRDDRPTGGDDRPKRPYQRRDDRPSGGDDRPKRPYQRRDDRPSGGDDRPKRPYQRRDDRPSGGYGKRPGSGPKRNYGPRKPKNG
jgi:hypothetical protein